MMMMMMKYFFVFIFLHSKWNQGLDARSTISGSTVKAPFDHVTGYASSNVPAYSNRDDNHFSSGSPHFLYGIYTGAKWQCVEYARRWLFIRKGCIFNDVPGAADIWNLRTVQRVVDRQCFGLTRHPNGSPFPPQNESLLIYARAGGDMSSGHVSVIVDVSSNFIRVAEQNYYPYYWKGNFARQITYTRRNGLYYIEDNYPIIGWITVDDARKQTKPLNQSIINKIKRNKKTPNFKCQ